MLLVFSDFPEKFIKRSPNGQIRLLCELSDLYEFNKAVLAVVNEIAEQFPQQLERGAQNEFRIGYPGDL